MNTKTNNDFEFMTSSEITKSLAKKIKLIRKKRFKTQEIFAKHIGISYSKYARYEKSGQIQLIDFIEVVKGINRIGEIQNLFELEKEVITW